MTKAELHAQEVQEQIENLRAWFPKGSTVYTILRHVSRSGMRRQIGVVAILGPDDIRHPNYAVSTALGYRLSDGDGVIVYGAGMDMGFHLVHSLALKLYGDGYALNHRWL